MGTGACQVAGPRNSSIRPVTTSFRRSPPRPAGWRGRKEPGQLGWQPRTADPRSPPPQPPPAAAAAPGRWEPGAPGGSNRVALAGSAPEDRQLVPAGAAPSAASRLPMSAAPPAASKFPAGAFAVGNLGNLLPPSGTAPEGQRAAPPVVGRAAAAGTASRPAAAGKAPSLADLMRRITVPGLAKGDTRNPHSERGLQGRDHPPPRRTAAAASPAPGGSPPAAPVDAALGRSVSGPAEGDGERSRSREISPEGRWDDGRNPAGAAPALMCSLGSQPGPAAGGVASGDDASGGWGSSPSVSPLAEGPPDPQWVPPDPRRAPSNPSHHSEERAPAMSVGRGAGGVAEAGLKGPVRDLLELPRWGSMPDPTRDPPKPASMAPVGVGSGAEGSRGSRVLKGVAPAGSWDAIGLVAAWASCSVKEQFMCPITQVCLLYSGVHAHGRRSDIASWCRLSSALYIL